MGSDLHKMRYVEASCVTTPQIRPKPKTLFKQGLKSKEITKEITKNIKERPATENTPGKPKTSKKSIGLRGSDDMFRLSRSVSTKEYMTE